MTLIRHRLPAESAVLEPKMLLSVVVSVLSVVATSVMLLLVVGGCVVGRFLTLNLGDTAPHSFRVNTMVRFSPAGRRGGIMVKTLQLCGADGEKRGGDVPLLRIDRSVKFAQQVLNRMVVFPASPPTAFPLEFFRLAVTVRVVTPTETQLPCRQHRSARFFPQFETFNPLSVSVDTWYAFTLTALPHLLIHSHETGLLLQRTHVLPGDGRHDEQQVVHAGHVVHCRLVSRDLRCGFLRSTRRKPCSCRIGAVFGCD